MNLAAIDIGGTTIKIATWKDNTTSGTNTQLIRLRT